MCIWIDDWNSSGTTCSLFVNFRCRSCLLGCHVRSELQLGHHRMMRLRCSDIDLSRIWLMLIHWGLTWGTRYSLLRRMLSWWWMHLLHYKKIMRHRRRLLIWLPWLHLNLRHINKIVFTARIASILLMLIGNDVLRGYKVLLRIGHCRHRAIISPLIHSWTVWNLV